MDYYGFSLWHDLLAGSSAWFESLDIDYPGGFDPDEDGFDVLFSRLERVLDEAGMKGKLGGCFHVSSNFIDMVERLSLIDTFNEAVTRFSKQVPFQLGMHCTFGENDLPLRPRYVDVLAHDILLARMAGANCIVAHPPAEKKDCSKELVALLTSPPIIAILDETEVALHWENMGHDSHFGSLAALLSFRHMLQEALERAGRGEMIDRHLFCLDTGHLLLYLSSGSGNVEEREAEIAESLPAFANNIQSFHLHANDGTKDHHVVPGSTDFLDHPSRENIDHRVFTEHSKLVMSWLRVCERFKERDNRHVHVEALRVPFSLGQLSAFGKAWIKQVK